MASITTIPTSGPAKPAMAGAAVMSQSLELDFRKSGNAKGHCNFGWSEPEDAETWMVGTSGTLVVPRPAAAVPHLLVLHLRPHVQHGRLPLQRLRVLVNGIFVAAFTLTDATTVRACEIPAAALRATPLMICFQTPDATRPSDISDSSDRRQLSVAFSALRLYPDQLHADPTGPGGSAPLTWAAPARPALAELMMQFESLGENCEFGLAQRRCAAEPLGLLRFASAPLPKLLEALLDGFSGMGAPGTIAAEISANGKEFMVQDNRYGLLYHAWVDAGAMTADEVVGREARRVPFLGPQQNHCYARREFDKFVVMARYGEGVIFDADGASNSPGFLNNMETLPEGLRRDGDHFVADRAVLARAPYLPGTWTIFANGNLQNYYHWLVESMLALEVLRVVPGAGERTVLPAHLPPEGRFDHLGLLRLLGHEAMAVERTPAAFVRCQAVVHLQDGGIDSLPAHILRGFQARVAARFGGGPRRRICILRRELRAVANQAELDAVLAPLGFVNYRLEEMSVEAQIRLFANAEWVVAPHGAGLSNLVYAPPGCRVIELMPECEMRPFFWQIGVKMGHRYG